MGSLFRIFGWELRYLQPAAGLSSGQDLEENQTGRSAQGSLGVGIRER